MSASHLSVDGASTAAAGNTLDGASSRPPSSILPSQSLFCGLRVAVLAPCYNEEIAIAGVVADFQARMPWAQIYVYDNNSSDSTALVASAAGARVGREGRQGKGHVVRRMFAEIDADYYVLVDGDGTYSAEDSLQLLAAAVAGRCDLVNGRRPHEGKERYRPGHTLGNKVLTSMVRGIFGSGFEDMLSGSKVFSRRFVKSFPGMSRGFEIETDLTVHALGLDMVIAEMPISYGARPVDAPSKLNTFRDGIRILLAIVRLFRMEKPLAFFSALTAVLMAACVALALPVITTYLATGLVPRFPTAVLALGIGLLGFGSLFAGVVLDTVTMGRRELRRLHYLMLTEERARPARGAREEAQAPSQGTAQAGSRAA